MYSIMTTSAGLACEVCVIELTGSACKWSLFMELHNTLINMQQVFVAACPNIWVLSVCVQCLESWHTQWPFYIITVQSCAEAMLKAIYSRREITIQVHLFCLGFDFFWQSKWLSSHYLLHYVDMHDVHNFVLHVRWSMLLSGKVILINIFINDFPIISLDKMSVNWVRVKG